MQIFLGDVFDELLDSGSNRQYLPWYRLYMLRHEQVRVVPADLSQLGHQHAMAARTLAPMASSQSRLVNEPALFDAMVPSRSAVDRAIPASE